MEDSEDEEDEKEEKEKEEEQEDEEGEGEEGGGRKRGGGGGQWQALKLWGLLGRLWGFLAVSGASCLRRGASWGILWISWEHLGGVVGAS